MIKIHPTAIIEDDVKIGRLNLPTLMTFTLLLSVFALFAVKFNRTFDNLFFGVFLFAGLMSFVLGIIILGFCFLRRQEFNGENRKYLRQNVLLGLAAFTSPIWLIIISLFIIGFNR